MHGARDACCCWDWPSSSEVTAGNGEINHDGKNHTADSCHAWRKGMLKRVEFTNGKFVTEFDSHDKEEDNKQTIGDPVTNAEVDL